MNNTEKINEKVAVIMIYDNVKGSVYPAKVRWRGREYRVNKLNYHWPKREGRTMLHFFQVSNDTVSFKLKLDTDNLHWTLMEVYDTAGS